MILVAGGNRFDRIVCGAPARDFPLSGGLTLGYSSVTVNPAKLRFLARAAHSSDVGLNLLNG